MWTSILNMTLPLLEAWVLSISYHGPKTHKQNCNETIILVILQELAIKTMDDN